MLAGPIFNFILGFIIAFIMVNLIVIRDPVATEIVDGGAAQEAGLEAGDRILSLNGSKIHLYEEIQLFTLTYRGGEVAVEYERDGVIEEHQRFLDRRPLVAHTFSATVSQERVNNCISSYRCILLPFKESILSPASSPASCAAPPSTISVATGSRITIRFTIIKAMIKPRIKLNIGPANTVEILAHTLAFRKRRILYLQLSASRSLHPSALQHPERTDG